MTVHVVCQLHLELENSWYLGIMLGAGCHVSVSHLTSESRSERNRLSVPTFQGDREQTAEATGMTKWQWWSTED